MMTIKAINSDGTELLRCDVKSVMYEPPIFETKKNPLLFVWYGDKNEVAETIRGTDVFIMNENGKTVGNYDVRTRFPETDDSK
jgi:hypothetical protein